MPPSPPLLQLLPPLQELAHAVQLRAAARAAAGAPLPAPGAPLLQLPAAPGDAWLDLYSSNALSRVGGGGSAAAARRMKPIPRRLIVDVREFMSTLPAVLHGQGFELVPITLEVRRGRGGNSWEQSAAGRSCMLHAPGCV
jgi:hypothetical protein